MSEIIRDRQYRDSFRSVILNHLGNDEIFAFHPDIVDLVFSNKGRVKNYTTGKFLKPFKNSDGYQMINVRYFKKGRRCVMLHRLISETFFGYLGTDNYFYEVNHIVPNKDNNSLENLEWLTRRENLDHSKQLKLSPIYFGIDNGNSKLSFDDIKDILQLRDLGFSIVDIAKSFKCNRNYISLIINKKVRTKK